MTHPNTTIAGQLRAAQLAIANSMADTEIQALVAGYGYTATRLAEGRAVFDTARAAVSAQEGASGHQQDASQALERARKEAFDAYQSLAKVALAVSRQPSLAGLGLTGPMPRSTAAFLTSAVTLFDNATQLEALASYGYDAARLQVERARIEACGSADDQLKAAMGAAQQATSDQDKALETLNQWMRQYLKIAKVALRGKPQLREKLGILARSAPTAAQLAARSKTREPVA